MKIGDFAKRFNIPISTVRYYVDKGILLPKRQGTQFLFCESDLREMQIIQELKALMFSIQEIKKYLSILRIYDFHDRRKDDKLIDLINNKVFMLKSNRNEIEKNIHILEARLNKDFNTKGKIAEEGLVNGIPLDFIPMLQCSNCSSSFRLDNVTILNNSIISGNFNCNCGNTLKIDEGIITVAPSSQGDYYSSEEFHMMHYNELPKNSKDFVYFQYIDDITSEAVSLLSKGYLMIDNYLNQSVKNNKVFFVPDLSSHYLYKYAVSGYFKDALIIVSGYTLDSIRAIKSHIEHINPALKILYIANTVYELPLQNKCIDVWIDAVSSFNFSFYHSFSLHEKIHKYLKQEADIIGITKYYLTKSKTEKVIKQMFPKGMENNVSPNWLRNCLNENSYRLIGGLELGHTCDPGKYYQYHSLGEKQFYFLYNAKISLDNNYIKGS